MDKWNGEFMATVLEDEIAKSMQNKLNGNVKNIARYNLNGIYFLKCHIVGKELKCLSILYVINIYHTDSIECLGHLFTFGISREGAYSRQGAYSGQGDISF